MSNKCLDGELFDLYMQDGKVIIESLREIYEKGRADEREKFAKWVEDRLNAESLPCLAEDILWEYKNYIE